MPRRARLAVAGIPWHIIQRGNNRQACFYTDEDYCFYFETLRAQAEQWRCAIHACVLMTSHVHLLLTPWEGRYRSCLAQSGNYVLACYRYIELNPVRAGMVGDARDYRWSSHSANALGHDSTLLSPHADWLSLGRTVEARTRAYRQTFDAYLKPQTMRDIRSATNGGFVLGNRRFAEEIETMLRRRLVPGKPGRPKKQELITNCSSRVLRSN